MKLAKLFTLLLLASLLLFAVGCQQEDPTPTTTAPTVTEPGITEPPVTETSPTDLPEEIPISDGIHAGHIPGYRFPMTILLEGMEEPVNAEHFEDSRGIYRMDYFYEDFDLQQSGDSQTLLWKYTAAEPPVNYMRIRIDKTAGAAQLSREVVGDLEGAEPQDALVGNHKAIMVTVYQESSSMTFYFFDTTAGCVIIEMNCALEALEGIGSRMQAMLDTLEVLA